MSKNAVILDSGIVTLKRRLMEDGTNAEVRAQLARAYNIRAMHVEALEQCTRLLETDPGDGAIWHEAIRSTFFIDERTISELRGRYLEQAVSFQDQPWYQRNLALLTYYAGEEEQARQDLESYLAEHEEDHIAWEILGDIQFNQGNHGGAQKSLETSLNRNPENAAACHLLGTCYYGMEETEKALYYYQKAVQLEEKFARAWISLGEFFLREQAGFARALQCFGTATFINPHNWDAYFFLIDFYLRTKKYELGMAECLRILELGAEDKICAEAFNHMGYIQFKQGMYEEAEESYRKAIAMAPRYSSPYQNLGLLYQSRRETDRARIYYKRAIKMDPTAAWSHTKLGFIYLDERVVERAEGHFKEARQHDPEDFWALLGLAEVSRLRRKYDRQLQYCLEAVELQPGHTNVQNHLGIAYECNRKHKEAESAYRKAMELDQYNRWAANNLGYLYEKLMKRDNTEKYRKKAIDIWRKRLHICSKTGTSIRGATRHLIKLGIPQKQVESWLLE